MKSYFFIIAFLGFVSCDPDKEPGKKPNVTEGDMVLTPEQKNMLYSQTRNGVTDTRLRWPNAQVFFWFDNSIPNNDRNLVIEALVEIQRYTCVRFYQGANSKNEYILVTNKDPGCFAYVGYLRYPGQQLNLGSGCMYKSTVIHEFLHALGFYHMQSTYDRDDYVYIHYENMEPGTEHNFNKYTNQEVMNFGVPYDYASIMHYGPYTFSKNNKPTISAKFSGGENMGKAKGLSYYDIMRINRMYKC